MKTFQIIAFLLLLLLTACERQTEWTTEGQNLNVIAVEGILTSEDKTHVIKIMHPVKELNTPPEPVTKAEVTINDGDNIYYLSEQSDNPGNYKTDAGFYAIAGETYTLQIKYNGKKYYANAYTPPGEMFTPLIYVKSSEKDMYHIHWVAGIYNPQKSAIWDVLLDWSSVPGYENKPKENCQARLLYYTLPTLDVGEIFVPELEKVNFPAGTIITQKRYAVTPEYAEYLRAVLSETNWQGGLFDVARSNVPTNFNEGCIGYFASCSVTSVSFKVTP